MDVDRLRSVLSREHPKLLYTVPNFQNPPGISYSESNRLAVSEVLAGTETLLIEDDPYGELRFAGGEKPSFKELLPSQTVLLGSFSKAVAPGLRLGWIAASEDLMQKLVTAKQATDLHTSHFTQSVVYQYLRDNDLSAHLSAIREVYGRQCRAMQRSMREHFPLDMRFTEPEGGGNGAATATATARGAAG